MKIPCFTKTKIPAMFILLAVMAVHTIATGHGGKKEILPEGSTLPENLLPGVTWTDDIHPIFIRNKCYKCHTRGKEDTVEGLDEFALGLVDEDEPGNSFLSFHELVYTEGRPNITDGETLRDGQCCWPLDFPTDQRRRIWLGHPERSVLVRKLSRDYYDWNEPPRYLEEGLRLKWGLPMPLWKDGDEEDEKSSAYSPSLWNEIVLRAMLIVGRGEDKLKVLRPSVPAADRLTIREWIADTLQLKSDGTSINIKVTFGNGEALVSEEIRMVGNFVLPSHAEVRDSLIIKTDDTGVASLEFPDGSVVSREWHVALLTGDRKNDYEKIIIKPGEATGLTLAK